jgi:multiple sugar transport system permease protein
VSALSDTQAMRAVGRSRRSSTDPARSQVAIQVVLLILGSAVFIYPFLWMISTSLRTDQGIAAGGVGLWPVQWQFDNYVEALSSFPFWQYLGSTVLATLIPVVTMVIGSSIAGFAFARIPIGVAGSILFAIVLATMLLPGEVTLVPQFILFREFNMIDTLYPIVLPTMFGGPFFIFLFRQFYLRLPESLTDAAIVDGASWFRIWRSIYLPLSQPVIVAAAVIQFMYSWNNFLGPSIYLHSNTWKTLPIALVGFTSTHGTDTALLMAASIVVVLPCVIIFFLAQRHIIGGIAFTGSK